MKRILSVLLIVALVVSASGPVAVAQTDVPAGMVGVPNANISEDVPLDSSPPLSAIDLEGSVMTSDHAESLEVIVTTPDRASDYLDDGAELSGSQGLSLVLQDETHSAGRQVAIDAGAVRDALGYTPERVYGTHEGGEKWSREIEYQGGMLLFEVPHFSSNSVTFSSEVSVTGTYTDGSTVSYDVSSADSVSNLSINVTGDISTETDTESGLVSDGESIHLSVAGNEPPEGASVTVSRPVVNQTKSNIDLHGDGGTDSSARLVGDSGSGLRVHSEIRIRPDGPGEITTLTPNVELGSGEDYDPEVDIYLIEETPDEDADEGTLIKSGWTPDWSAGAQTIELDTQPHVDAGTDYTIGFVTTTSDGDGISDYLRISTDSSASETWYARSNDFSESLDEIPDLSYNLQPDATAVSISGDSSTSFGSIESGSSKTETVPISLSTSELDASFTGGGEVTVEAEYTERSSTVDPKVEVNGHTTTHTGSVADGETVTLDTSDSWIEEGANSINVTVGDGTLSDDAPSPAIGLNYTHKAQDQQSVQYTATKWTESYEVSKTFASDREAATLTIPFDSEVVEIESLEARTNGGSWSSVSPNDYSLDETTLTVDLGSVSGGDEVSVRTTGQQVLSVNSSITVLEPTAPGGRLDTRVRVEEWDETSSISVGRTEDAGRIHYTYNESWENADSHVEITADGKQQLYLPGAGELSEFNVRTVPVRVNARSGEVEISMRDPSTTEPSFYVSPGATENDDVEYTLLTASDGEEYILRSETNNVVHDSATASSPVTLVDDDSEELLVIEQDSTTASEDDGPSAVGLGPAQIDTDTPLNSVPVILLVGAAILIGLAVVYRRLGWSIRDAAGPVPVDPVFALAAGLIAFVVIDYVGGGVLTSALAANIKQIGSGFSQIVPLLGIGGAALLGYWLYQNYILGNSGGGGDGDSSRTIIIRDGGGNE